MVKYLKTCVKCLTTPSLLTYLLTYHTTWQHVLIQIKSPNDLDTCHVKWVPETTFWHKKLNQTLGPFGDSSWHAQPILPKFGGVFCLCTISPQKGPKVSFDSLCQKVVLGVQTTFRVSKLFGLLICINTSCQVVCNAFVICCCVVYKTGYVCCVVSYAVVSSTQQ